jgi:hypothetical protein
VDAVARILQKRLKPISLSPHKTNIHVTPQLVSTIKSLNFSSNGDNTYAGCTKGITIFAVPWRTADAINKDTAKDKYFAAAMLKLVADIRKHVTGAKVELPTSHRGLVRVINNYCHLLEVLFGPDCPHLLHVGSIRGTLETHEANLESRLTGSLILHLMWRLHYNARQFFLACESWDNGESLPRSALGLLVCQLVNDCSIQLTLMCPEALFLGPPPKLKGAPMPAATRMGWPAVAGPQPTSNASIPPLCQKIVALFNRLYPTLTLHDSCTQGKVSINRLRIGRPGVCINFGLLGRCPGCKYRHKVCSVSDSHQAEVVKVIEGATATMKAAPAP